MSTNVKKPMDRLPKKDRLLKKPEVAEMLGTTENTLSYWVSTGYAPPSAKLGRRRVWRESECLAWLDAQFKAGADAS